MEGHNFVLKMDDIVKQMNLVYNQVQEGTQWIEKSIKATPS